MSPADRDVLTSLPNARPTRRSAKRASTAATEKPETEAAKTAKKRAPAAKKAPAATAKAPAKTAGTTKAKAKPKAAASTAGAAKKAAAAPSSPPPPAAGWATPKPERPEGGGDLLGTAVQAVGELAQIGLAYGGQAIKQALSRLPRP
ncbi:MAG TPA: hypothetical protein VI318_18570 [Baekduia sp.]